MTEATAMRLQLPSADRHLIALFEASQRWIIEQGLVLVEIEYILGQTGKLLEHYRGRLTAEKLPESLRAPYELMVWARPERAEEDVTGLEQYSHWFARWLVLCLPGDQDMQNAVCCVILIRAQSRAQRFVY
jgi:hypothetical protein